MNFKVSSYDRLSHTDYLPLPTLIPLSTHWTEIRGDIHEIIEMCKKGIRGVMCNFCGSCQNGLGLLYALALERSENLETVFCVSGSFS